MKEIVGELGEIKIPLNLDAKPVKQRPYKLNLVYKKKVKVEIDRMIEAWIIETVAKSKCISLMVAQNKKT
jgi:hypothetical protein